jgi:Fe-S-cluster containining protein
MHLDYDPATRLAEAQAESTKHMVDLTNEETVAQFQMITTMLEQYDTFPDGAPKYRCKHFTRDADGLGVCTVYDHRPRMCANFPYGEPATFAGCAWNVRRVPRKLPVLNCS